MEAQKEERGKAIHSSRSLVVTARKRTAPWSEQRPSRVRNDSHVLTGAQGGKQPGKSTQASLACSSAERTNNGDEADVKKSSSTTTKRNGQTRKEKNTPRVGVTMMNPGMSCQEAQQFLLARHQIQQGDGISDNYIKY
ncbi:hypothetical protein R1flu_022420 [Riccia fluitans]|uniref:Uncharacterized protein n=1 Tax=Riccia fluitans TaxID=41844 RepID=A0ABD1ZSR7_9MARC